MVPRETGPINPRYCSSIPRRPRPQRSPLLGAAGDAPARVKEHDKDVDAQAAHAANARTAGGNSTTACRLRATVVLRTCAARALRPRARPRRSKRTRASTRGPPQGSARLDTPVRGVALDRNGEAVRFWKTLSYTARAVGAPIVSTRRQRGALRQVQLRLAGSGYCVVARPRLGSLP